MKIAFNQRLGATKVKELYRILSSELSKSQLNLILKFSPWLSQKSAETGHIPILRSRHLWEDMADGVDGSMAKTGVWTMCWKYSHNVPAF